MRLVKVGMPEFNEAGNEILGIMNRWLPEAQWQLTMQFCCDECGAKSDKMIRVEVPISKRKTKPHDICAECLAKAIKMLEDTNFKPFTGKIDEVWVNGEKREPIDS